MKRLWLGILVTAVFLLVACSGPASTPDQPGTNPTTAATSAQAASTATPTPTAVPTSTPTPSPTATPTPTPVPPTPTPTPIPTPTVPTLPTTGAAGQTQEVPILMYHYVRPDPGPNDPVGQDLSVTPQDFATEMQWIDDHGYTTMTLSELAGVRAGKLKLPDKPVVLTFDDGYDDFYTAAWPILQKHHFKATIFMITAFVDQPRYMTWDQVSELDKSGYVEVGAHTEHHVNLSAQTTDVAWQEINGSKQAIEQHIGHSITAFCYPSGRYSDSVVAQVKQAGFTMATTTQPGFAKASDNPLLLPRVRIHGTIGLPYVQANLP